MKKRELTHARIDECKDKDGEDLCYEHEIPGKRVNKEKVDGMK